MAGESIKVARVIDSTTLVFNAGSQDDIKVGMNFIVIGIGPDIVDPETQENLGTLELVRGRVTITHVQERISTAVSNQQTKLPGRKRIITRPNNAFLTMMGSGKEEIEEDVTYETRDLVNVQTGDIAKRY